MGDHYLRRYHHAPAGAGLTTTRECLDMLKFLASTVGIIFLIGLAVVIGLLMLIF
ncbi:small membrane protein YohP [Billgrantia sp. C5P2]|uniref:hypothetical protein n=1 Tax=Billgrantia sp. C5P2 TaxID=3436239 RepID=UPI0040599F43